jgi:hypothetical protein
MVLQSCSGLSFKSQVLYLLVFVTRYLGMFALAAVFPSPGADAQPGDRFVLVIHRIPIPHHLQAPVHRILRLHHLFDAQRLQADP